MREYVDGITIKKLGLRREELFQIIAEVAAKGFRFHRTPLDHQLLSVVFGLQFDGVGFWHEMRVGKTQCAIDLTAAKGIESEILVVTVNAALETWENEFKQVQPKYKVKVVRGSWQEKNAIVEKRDADVYIIAFEGLTKVERNNNAPKNVKDFILPALDRRWKMLIVDESRAIMNPNAKRSKVCMKLARQSANRILLSGLPIAKSLMELFSQQYCLDLGLRLSDNFNHFRWFYFDRVKRWTYDEWIPAPGSEEKLSKVMYQQGIRYSQDECLQLPSKKDVIRWVDMKGDQLAFYQKFKEEKGQIVVTKKNRFEVEAIAQRFLQICGGWLKLPNAEKKGEVEVLTFKSNPKLEELEYLLDNDLFGKKVVVVASFVAEQKGILDFLEKKGLKPLSILAGAGKEAFATAKLFNESKDRNHIVISPRVGGKAISLTGAHYMVFFSQDFDIDVNKQVRERVQGVTQKHPVTYVKLMCRNSIDERVEQVLSENRSFISKVVEGKRLIDLL